MIDQINLYGVNIHSNKRNLMVVVMVVVPYMHGVMGSFIRFNKRNLIKFSCVVPAKLYEDGRFFSPTIVGVSPSV